MTVDESLQAVLHRLGVRKLRIVVYRGGPAVVRHRGESGRTISYEGATVAAAVGKLARALGIGAGR